MLAARIRAWSHPIVLMKPRASVAREPPPPPPDAGSDSSGCNCCERLRWGIVLRSVVWSVADLGVQRQGNLVLRRTIQVTVPGINSRDALDVFARLRKGDQLDEFVGRVLRVLHAPAPHHARPAVVCARGQLQLVAELPVKLPGVLRAEVDVDLRIVKLVGEER